MSESALVPQEDEYMVPLEGPATPDDDETYGPEPDDPRASGRYADPYDVPDYDPAHEQHASCCEAVDS